MINITNKDKGLLKTELALISPSEFYELLPTTSILITEVYTTENDRNLSKNIIDNVLITKVENSDNNFYYFGRIDTGLEAIPEIIDNELIGIL